jgi:hypothetical protein
MAYCVSSVAFGDGDRGVQVGQSNAPIQASFYYPPGTYRQASAPSGVDSANFLSKAGRTDPAPIRVDPLPS